MYCLAVIFKHWYCLHKNKKKEPVFSLIISWWTLNAVYILLIQNITEGKGLSSQISDFPELFYVFSFPILFQEWIIPLVVNPDNPQLCSQTHNLILPCWCCSWNIIETDRSRFCNVKALQHGKRLETIFTREKLSFQTRANCCEREYFNQCFLNLTKYFCCLNRQWQKTESLTGKSEWTWCEKY